MDFYWEICILLTFTVSPTPIHLVNAVKEQPPSRWTSCSHSGNQWNSYRRDVVPHRLGVCVQGECMVSKVSVWCCENHLLWLLNDVFIMTIFCIVHTDSFSPFSGQCITVIMPFLIFVFYKSNQRSPSENSFQKLLQKILSKFPQKFLRYS